MLSEYWKNEFQHWAKSKLDFLLYELLHEQICGFFSLKFILPRPKQNRGRIFILFKYFLNNLFSCSNLHFFALQVNIGIPSGYFLFFRSIFQ